MTGLGPGSLTKDPSTCYSLDTLEQTICLKEAGFLGVASVLSTMRALPMKVLYCQGLRTKPQKILATEWCL